MNFHDVCRDAVISGYVVTAVASYEEALEALYPLIGRLEMQRDPLQTKFYTRLEDDIVRGCVMPPLTIALIHNLAADEALNNETVFNRIRDTLKDGFVLDGIQRLTTLNRASKKPGFDPARPIHVNFVLTDSRDRLLYRMITLNNGQRPMSARHQIEVLADVFFNFDHINLDLVPEKGNGRVRAPNAFKKGDFVKGYIAYLSNSVSIDNQKIIEEKMDELIASRIIESDIPTSQIEFSEVINLINHLSENPEVEKWIKVQNNFIGFCVGVKSSLAVLQGKSHEEFLHASQSFEKAFSAIDVSKVNLGRVRRELVSKFIAHFDELSNMEEFELLNRISDWI